MRRAFKSPRGADLFALQPSSVAAKELIKFNYAIYGVCERRGEVYRKRESVLLPETEGKMGHWRISIYTLYSYIFKYIVIIPNIPPRAFIRDRNLYFLWNLKNKELKRVAFLRTEIRNAVLRLWLLGSKFDCFLTKLRWTTFVDLHLSSLKLIEG